MVRDGFSASGRSILEILWEELDDIVNILMRDEGELEEAQVELRGRAQGVTYAIAVLSDPYNTNVEAVKQTAMQRWESRNPDTD